MCRPANCPACDKTTWAGCGQHVSDVMRHVPRNQRCTCTPEQRAAARPSLGKSIARMFSR